MRGSVGWQCAQVLTQSGILQIGSSKHAAKEEARADGAKSWADMGERLGIYSYNTAEAYKSVWINFMAYAKSEMGLKDIEKIETEHIEAYLQHRLEEDVSRSTYDQTCAALGKLENALNMYSHKFGRGNEYQFRDAIRTEAKAAHRNLEKPDQHRAYEDPRALINALSRPDHVLAAKIQLEGGARIYEASLIKESQIKGLTLDSITGETVGQISLTGKGGKERTIQVSEATYNDLQEWIASHDGRFSFKHGAYRNHIRKAAETAGQEYSSSHGLRWNFAQNRMETTQDQGGRIYEQAMAEVSREMGHGRADITEHYLR